MRSNKTLVVLLIVLVLVVVATTLILLGPQIFPITHQTTTMQSLLGWSPILT
jgi:hypothetical protein